ncbi:MAG: tetratricopeptide repeat protein [Burkholderiales bacterium]
MRRAVSIFFLFVVTLSASARDGASHWSEVRTQHFVVLTDSNEKQARRVASQLERMRAVFHVLLPTASDTAGSPVIVLALKDKKAFQALEPEAYLAKGQLDLAGLFMRAPDKNYILLRLDAQGDHPYATIYHEYTHFMLRNASEWIPLWLNEGLAEFYQNSDIEEKEVLLGQPSEDDILYLRQNRLLPLTTLLKVDQTSPYYHEEQKGSVFYAESWALTHFIRVTDRQKGTDRLQDYAKRLIKKEDPVIAAQEAFGDLSLLQKSLNSYISQGQFMMFKMNTGVTVDESTFQFRAIPTTDADSIRADVLVYNQRPKDAQALIDAVLRDDPKNALAHETMGYLKFREGDMESARKWYGEAVQLDSQSYLAHYYYAIMSMKSGDNSQDPEIESSLRTCMKLNPDFAPAYDALAMRYSMNPAKVDEAHFLNVQAINLEPDNVNYRMNAAAVLANGRRYDDALRVLKAATHVAKTPEQVAFVQARIDQIERYQSAVAQSRQRLSDDDRQSFTSGDADTRSVTVTTSDGRKFEIKSDPSHEGPKYPTEALTGPRHTVRGILRNVQCSYPMTITLNVEPGGKAKAVAVYRNNFSQIVFTVMNFTPKSDLNPCTDIEGFKAKVEYAEVSDKSIAGQIVAIELSK